MIATYAFYDHLPVPCEGDDPIARSMRVETTDAEKTRDQLQEEHGGWIQIWDIE